jgi:ATP-dependent protease ClpP protease subunit
MAGRSTFLWSMLYFLRIVSSDFNVWLIIGYAFSITSLIAFAGDPQEPFGKLTRFHIHTPIKYVDIKR